MSITKTSKKDLRAIAEAMGAVEILGRRSNIYNYENERDKICRELGATYDGVAYSAGTYGNTGRIDAIKKFDRKADAWHIIKHVFYTE